MNYMMGDFQDAWQSIQLQINLLIDTLENGAVNEDRACVEANKLCTNLCMMQTNQQHQQPATSSDYQSLLYKKYKDVMESYTRSTVLPSLRGFIGNITRTKESSTLFLEQIRFRWYNHHIMIKWLKNAFAYLDSHHVRVNDVPTLYQVGLDVFYVVIYTELKYDIVASCIEIINSDREESDHQNDNITVTDNDKILIKSAIELFETMGMGSLNTYQEDFEVPFLESTQEYYATRRTKFQQDTSYHDRVARILVEEKDRAREFSLHPSTSDKLRNVCNRVLNRTRKVGGGDGHGATKSVSESFFDAVFNAFA